MEAGQVTAGDMTGFMGNNANDLSGAGCLCDQAGVDKKPLPAGNEGVKGIIQDQVNFDRLFVKFSCA
jgi:hypothetical protein